MTSGVSDHCRTLSPAVTVNLAPCPDARPRVETTATARTDTRRPHVDRRPTWLALAKLGPVRKPSAGCVTRRCGSAPGTRANSGSFLAATASQVDASKAARLPPSKESKLATAGPLSLLVCLLLRYIPVLNTLDSKRDVRTDAIGIGQASVADGTCRTELPCKACLLVPSTATTGLAHASSTLVIGATRRARSRLGSLIAAKRFTDFFFSMASELLPASHRKYGTEIPRCRTIHTAVTHHHLRTPICNRHDIILHVLLCFSPNSVPHALTRQAADASRRMPTCFLYATGLLCSYACVQQ